MMLKQFISKHFIPTITPMLPQHRISQVPPSLLRFPRDTECLLIDLEITENFI
jgi:hypothetical protein